MSYQTAPDIPLTITVPGPSPPPSSSAAPLLSAERRINPSWTVSQLKAKLEPVTGIPPGSQRLRTRALDGSWVPMEGEERLVGEREWGLRRGGEIEVTDTRPPSQRQNFTDPSSVEKYQMPESQYEQLSDSVLAWKKKQKLGRFDPGAKSAAELAEERRVKDEGEIEAKGVSVGLRCRVGGDDGRRGVVRFVGEIVGLGGEREVGCRWVGVELDEPVGRNNGSASVEGEEGKVESERVFECRDKFGVFVRPEKVEVGEWPELDDLVGDGDMEEI